MRLPIAPLTIRLDTLSVGAQFCISPHWQTGDLQWAASDVFTVTSIGIPSEDVTMTEEGPVSNGGISADVEVQHQSGWSASFWGACPVHPKQ